MRLSTAMLGLLLLLYLGMIFYFSSQPAVKSYLQSGSVEQKIRQYIPELSKFLDIAKEHNISILRKAAHIGMFLILGIISYYFIRSLGKKSTVLLSLAVCLACAVFDEYHQLFVPGRTGNPLDILLNFAGASVGIFIVSLFNAALMAFSSNIHR